MHRLENRMTVHRCLFAVGVHFIAQFVILYLVKRNTQKYCDMVLLQEAVENKATPESEQNTETQETVIKEQNTETQESK